MDYKIREIPVILVKLALIVTFLILLVISLIKLASKEIRKDVKIDYEPTYPDVTICPQMYAKDLGKFLIIPTYKFLTILTNYR